jgi:hypothetical protein
MLREIAAPGVLLLRRKAFQLFPTSGSVIGICRTLLKF